jgi:hypothetical protein
MRDFMLQTPYIVPVRDLAEPCCHTPLTSSEKHRSSQDLAANEVNIWEDFSGWKKAYRSAPLALRTPTAPFVSFMTGLLLIAGPTHFTFTSRHAAHPANVNCSKRTKSTAGQICRSRTSCVP